ncbi:MAG TPA: type II toxin-antitoxin system HicA family toxin [Candidatus Acidoferrales bacterium]|nr:type II toxin-antitoxin system HicA family toxin [Candidatus Acidoferrales bacterium]
MPRLVIKGEKLLQILYKNFGVEAIRQHGSHVVVFRAELNLTSAIPVGKELKQGTLNRILKDLDLSKEDIRKYL